MNMKQTACFRLKKRFKSETSIKTITDQDFNFTVLAKINRPSVKWYYFTDRNFPHE